MNDTILERASILIRQSRHQEAISLLENHLEQFPDDFIAKYYYVISLVNSGQIERSRTALNALMAEEPDSPGILSLAAQVALAEEKFKEAEAFAGKLIEFAPESSDSHLLMARVKLAQRNYDRAIESADKALSLDPENIEALNLKTFVEGLLGSKSTKATLEESLKIDPENPYTIANQGMQLLREGKTKEALERLKYAMTLNPANELTRYALLEAIKSRFFLYRFFFKYKEWTARLTGTQLWILILGTYFGFRFLRTIARESPELAVILTPVLYVIAGLFLLTWICDPLMNLFLLLNRYGKLLLDQKHKTMAVYTGISLMFALILFVTHFVFDIEAFLMAALMFTLFMIPLGTFLLIDHPKNKLVIRGMTIGILGFGIIGTLLNVGFFTTIALIGVFAYQWIFNGMLIKENSRTIDL